MNLDRITRNMVLRALRAGSGNLESGALVTVDRIAAASACCLWAETRSAAEASTRSWYRIA